MKTGIYTGGRSRVETGVTFQNVAANDHARNALKDIADFLKEPEKYKSAGARIPHGVLLYGPPGTGKTLLARALAGEAKVPFIAVNGSDFVEMYVGVGARRVRDVFRKARKHGKCVIFIDEIDALGRERGNGSSDERDQTLNALLSEMSGFSPSDGIIVVAATNRAEIMDPALLRPGRFDRRIEVGLPGKNERLQILKLHAKGKKFSDCVSLEKLAAQTVFFSGASLENLLNEAAIQAVKRNDGVIEDNDIQNAFTKIVAGEDKNANANIREKAQIALHEAGHAVAIYAFQKKKIQRISILPSSNGAAGYNLSVPEEKSLFTRSDLLCQIAVLLSGRAAEQMIYSDMGITTGASGDLKNASEIAVSMIKDFGMGGKPYASESTLMKTAGGANIYSECDRILKEEFERAVNTLKENLKSLLLLSRALMEKETLTEQEINTILEDVKPCMSNECEYSMVFE
ncbi:MAG: AAA family ATPase [Clostridia bacterium]|nr:AAA family ATPase [Clostridia bacterium]